MSIEDFSLGQNSTFFRGTLEKRGPRAVLEALGRQFFQSPSKKGGALAQTAYRRLQYPELNWVWPPCRYVIYCVYSATPPSTDGLWVAVAAGRLQWTGGSTERLVDVLHGEVQAGLRLRLHRHQQGLIGKDHTGWHIRLLYRFCWHQSKSSVLVYQVYTFKCNLDFDVNKTLKTTWRVTLYIQVVTFTIIECPFFAGKRDFSS